MAYVNKRLKEKRAKVKANNADVDDYNKVKTLKFRKIRAHRG
ncbi:hypothetical protein [Clostridium tagluense]|nr:hypothetical protein [Clostridium tagluense]